MDFSRRSWKNHEKNIIAEKRRERAGEPVRAALAASGVKFSAKAREHGGY